MGGTGRGSLDKLGMTFWWLGLTGWWLGIT